MMITREDFKVESWQDLLSFSLITPFVALISPFLIAVYTLGFFLDLIGFLDT